MCTINSQCSRLLAQKSNIMDVYWYFVDISFFINEPSLRGKRGFNTATRVDVYPEFATRQIVAPKVQYSIEILLISYSFSTNWQWSGVSTPLPELMCTINAHNFRLLPQKSKMMIFYWYLIDVFLFNEQALRGKRGFNPATWVDVYYEFVTLQIVAP